MRPSDPYNEEVLVETTFPSDPRSSVGYRVNLAFAPWPRRRCRRTNTATSVPVEGMQQSHYVL